MKSVLRYDECLVFIVMGDDDRCIVWWLVRVVMIFMKSCCKDDMWVEDDEREWES